MRRLLYFSLLLNLLLIGAGLFALHRLGGWHFAWLRLQHQTAGLYHHRVQHFEHLDERPGSIVFLGDSQTEQAEWHELFGDAPIVLNRGVSGDFVNGVLGRLPEVLRHKPLKIYLLIGINDLIFGNSPVEIAQGYHNIVADIRAKSPDTELYLQSVLPVNNNLRRSGAENADIRRLNEHIRQIAKDYALPFIDLATPLSDADGNLSQRFSEDGLHLNGLGYVVWKNELKKTMETHHLR